MSVMQIVFLLTGLALFAVGAALAFAELKARAGALEVAAELVGYSTRSGASGGSYFHAVARYAGLDGEPRYLEASVGSSSPLGRVGDRLTVFVQPEDPDAAAIKSPLSLAIAVGVAVTGIVFCAVFFATFRPTPLSTASAAAVIGWLVWKLRSTLRGAPLLPEAWNEIRRARASARVFTERTKAEIRWAAAAALDTASGAQARTNRAAIPVLLVAGAGLVFLGGWLHRKTEVFLAKAVPAPGAVVDLVASDSDGSVTWAPLVEFEHEGRRHRFTDSVGSNPASYRRGDAVPVLYDPRNPADARIDRGRWNLAIPALIAAAGALFVVAGAWLLLRRGRTAPMPYSAPARP
jgi:hypothetical protein